MLSLGKFERISSNVGNHYGIVVADRQKVEIKSYLDLEKMYEEQNKRTHNSTLPKAGRSWWQKLFGSE